MDSNDTPRRTDVGYKRPPREHQFQKGHKPKPRKPKPQSKKETYGDVLWRILREERRVEVQKKVAWLPTSELIIRRAFALADKGHSTMRRLTMDLLMAGEKPRDADDPGETTIYLNPGVRTREEESDTGS